MINRLIFFVVLIVACSKSHAQETTRSLDFVIVVNEKVAVGSISQLQLKLINLHEIEEDVEISYFPGNLSMKEKDYDRLLSSDTRLIKLQFGYSEKVANTDHFEVILEKSWIRSLYNVLYVYDLNKKPYSKWWGYIRNDKPYVVELDSPGNTFRVPRKVE